MKYLVADGSAEGLFWLAMAVVWIVVQIISRAAKQQMRRGTPRPSPAEPRPSPAPPSRPDTSLEDFLRSLGAEPTLPPRPVAGPEPEPTPLVAAEPVPSARVRKRKIAKPLAPTPPMARPPPAPVSEEPWQAIRPTAEPEVAAEGKRLRRMLVIPRIPVVNVQGLRIPGLAFQGNTISNLRPGPDRFPLKGRAALRQAMLHRLILEPPHNTFPC